LIDSDVLLYEPIEPYFAHYASSRLTVTSPGPAKTAAAGFALVNEPGILAELCRTYTDMFSLESVHLLKHMNVPSFTEMVGLYLLWKSNPNTVTNTHEAIDNFAINSSILEDRRFVLENGILAIKWRSGIPLLKRADSGEDVKSPIIHFHGHAKKIMRRHLKLRCVSVQLQHAINRIVSAIAKYPMRATNKIMQRYFFPGI